MTYYKNVFEKVRFSWRGSPSYGPRPALMGPYEFEKPLKRRKQFSLIGAFRGPVTLP